MTSRLFTRAVHAFMLAATNLAAIVMGFGVYWVVGPVNQIAVQVPVAAVLSVVGFAVWLVASNRLLPLVVDADDATDAVWVYVLAIPWAMALFAPLHLVTQGYVTSMGNLVAIAVFQGVVNLIAVPAAVAMVRVRRPA